MKALKDAGIKQERTGYNNPDADAYIERWFRTLKEETVWPGGRSRATDINDAGQIVGLARRRMATSTRSSGTRAR